jgi:hypothetical protein
MDSRCSFRLKLNCLAIDWPYSTNDFSLRVIDIKNFESLISMDFRNSSELKLINLVVIDT